MEFCVTVQRRKLAATKENRLSIEVTDVPAYSSCTVSVAGKLSGSVFWGPDAVITFETPPQGTLC